MESLTHEEKKQVFDAYVHGIIEEDLARRLVGRGWFMVADENYGGTRWDFTNRKL